MKGEQKEGLKKVLEQVGERMARDQGKDFQKLSQEVLAKQALPKKMMGMSDAMVEGLYSQAYRLYNTGKYKDASQLFRMLILLDSTEPKFAMGLAACFHMMKEYTNALNMYALCGIIDPESPIPHYHASDCYIQMKDNLSAIVSLEMAVKRAGDKPEYHTLKDRAVMTIESLRKEAKDTRLQVPAKAVEEGKVKKKK